MTVALNEAEDAKGCADKLNKDLERARADLTSAQDCAARADEGRREAEISADMAHKVRAEAEDELDTLRQELIAEKAHVQEMRMNITRTDAEQMKALASAAAAAHALSGVQEDARRANEAKTEAEQAVESSRQQIDHLREYVHGLEAQIVEATNSAQRQQLLIEEQRSALRNASERASELEKSLSVTHADLDGKHVWACEFVLFSRPACGRVPSLWESGVPGQKFCVQLIAKLTVPRCQASVSFSVPILTFVHAVYLEWVLISNAYLFKHVLRWMMDDAHRSKQNGALP